MPTPEVSDHTSVSAPREADENRNLFFGSSDMAPAMNESEFRTAWDLYADKLELLPREPPTPAQKWGQRQERGIIQGFSEEMQIPIKATNVRFRDLLRPWRTAQIDALLDTSPPMILEVKKVRWSQADQWRDPEEGENGVPLQYLIQVLHQLSVTGFEYAWIAALIGDDDFRAYRITQDRVTEAMLIEEAENFWYDHVLARVPPEMGASHRASEYLKRRYPRNRGVIRQASEREIVWLTEYARVRNAQKLNQAERTALENMLKQAIGDQDGLEWAHGKLTWKRIKDSQEVNYEELATKLMVGFAADEIKSLKDEFTHPKPGYRKIYFRTDLAEDEE